MNELEVNKNMFDSIKHIDEMGNEYWLARELQKVLEYSQWRRFNETIERAKISCDGSNNNILDHFANVGKMVKTGDSVRKISDYKLSRYACYLIAQTNSKLKRDNVDNEYTANSVHYEIGKKVRKAIADMGGIMPEDLPTPEKSLKELGTLARK